MPWRTMVGLLALSLSAAAARAGDDKIFRSLTTAKMEAMLKRFKLDYKKTDTKMEGGLTYDYKKNKFEIRLYYYTGKDMMLDAVFGPLPLQKINLWNIGAKFSRAVLDKDDKGTFSVLESNLNFAGGVTEETVREFLNTFDEELKRFEAFFISAAPVKDIPTEEKIYKEVPAELVEKILGDLKFKYNKVDAPKKFGVVYEYAAADGLKMTLTNWGKDLMVSARFASIPLDKVNKYNLERKFVRVAAYKKNKGGHTSLESNLDCSGGISESILRHFITVFEGEARDFAIYVKKLPAEL